MHKGYLLSDPCNQSCPVISFFIVPFLRHHLRSTFEEPRSCQRSIHVRPIRFRLSLSFPPFLVDRFSDDVHIDYESPLLPGAYISAVHYLVTLVCTLFSLIRLADFRFTTPSSPFRLSFPLDFPPYTARFCYSIFHPSGPFTYSFLYLFSIPFATTYYLYLVFTLLCFILSLPIDDPFPSTV